MKARIILLVCAALLCGAMVARAAEWDLDAMSLEELYRVREAVDERIDALEASEGRVYVAGSYLIGRDIPAGDYVLVEEENAVFASVIVREGVTEDSGLVAHHLINRQAAVRFAEGKWLTLTEARAYPLSLAPKVEDGRTDEGGYVVGTTLPAGAYTVQLVDRAPLSSYSIYDGVLGSGEQLLKFEVIREATDINLNPGEYLELSGCRLAPKD